MKIKHSYQPLTYITYSIVGITVLSGILLSSNNLSFLSSLLFIGVGSTNGSNNASATTLNRTTSTNATVKVNTFCSMTARTNPGEEHTIIMVGGQYQDEIGITTMQTFCNDPNGYAIYAIGYTGGDNGVTGNYNTVLHSNILGSTYDIPTGTNTSGDTSSWAMKLTSIPGTYEPAILNGYNNYNIIPQNYTKVADYSSNTDLVTIGSSLTTTYAAYIKPDQPTGTYEGQVKYVLVHPASHLGPDYYYMQNVDEWGDTIAIGQEITAYDIRDNKSYTVRRMCMSGTGNTWQEKEANCTLSNSMLWMTQNLDLDLSKDVELTSEDTDLRVVDSKAYSAGYSQDSFSVIHWTPATTTIASINTSTGKFNNWVDDANKAYSADPDAGNPDNSWYATGEAYNSSLCYVNSNNQTCNYLNANNTVAPTYFSHTTFASNGNHGKIGNYYNWSAAIASSDSSGYNTSTYGNVANNPQNSICPKGWRLPTTSSVAAKNEFARLNNVYNSGSTSNGTGLINSPVYMVRSGYVDRGALNLAGYYGYYLSSTVYSANNAYLFYFRSDNVNLPVGYGRNGGWSVRCVSDY